MLRQVKRRQAFNSTLAVGLSSRKRSRGKGSQQKWFPLGAEWEQKHWKGRKERESELSGAQFAFPSTTNFLPPVSSAVFRTDCMDGARAKDGHWNDLGGGDSNLHDRVLGSERF